MSGVFGVFGEADGDLGAGVRAGLDRQAVLRPERGPQPGVHSEAPPAIVFVTAFDTPASDAFELAAVDYLRKPVAADRLSRAVDRVCAVRNGASRESDLQPDRLAVSTHGGRQVLLRPNEVSHFEASGDYVRVHTATESFLIRDTMARLTEAWSRHGFLRIHRGFSVRMSAVDEVRSSSTGRCVLVNEQEIPVSRRYARELTLRLTGERGAERTV